jgi:putative tryptophan/tyrosine transport system substrate-binding protein
VDSAREEAFLQGLCERGWIESQNILIERRYWENRSERLPTLAEEFVRLKVDIIVTSTEAGARAAKKVTTTIPIVMTTSADAVGQGIVASLARPGGNVTGLTNISPDLLGKRLELLKEAFPKVSRVTVLGCPRDSPVNVMQWDETQAAARVLKLRLQPVEVRGPEEVEDALRSLTRDRTDALFVHDCSRIPSSKTVELAAKSRLPAIYAVERFSQAGGLMFYGSSATDLARRAATYVDKILKGAKPADLPVEQPMKFEFVINLKTAKQIGVTIPPDVLARATKIIR